MQDQEEIPGKIDPLEGFQWLCPPGGEDRVVLYCTSLRGIRKTFEDCSTLQMILRSFCVRIDERDVSMDLQYRKELADLVGNLAPVPRLFMKGRYVGGAEEVRQLHEDRKLKRLFEGIPKDASQAICNGCGGMRFIPCLDCSGSCKRINEEREVMRCSDCNENGLIRCPICC
ncbi:hypothetical protein O6H91_13G011200 [Diphasiastrum complanatum]|nr:hypothetical protein O6H91_13G011200 [Diphasiastrum complanatum]